jgi:YidC/Oxa1 family membrane protein insertase
MLLSTKLMPQQPSAAQNDQQKMMMNIMPVMFCVFCYNVAAGLNLYILTSTVLGIVQNYLVHVSDAEMAEKPKKSFFSAAASGQRPKHFYAAAQAKKREMHKEELREKRNKRQRQDEAAGTAPNGKKKK